MILSVIIYHSYGNVKKHIDLPKVSIPDNSLVKIYGLGISFVIPEISKGKNIKTITYYEKCTGQPTVCRLGEGTDFAEYGAFLAQRTEMEKKSPRSDYLFLRQRHQKFSIRRASKSNNRI